MKKFLLSSVGLAAMLVGPAMAADMPVAAPPPPPVYYDWSGAYVGGNVGGVWYDVTRTYTGAPPFVGPAFNQTTHDSDGIFGFHAGAQWQYGAWVWGVEAALSACFDECRSYTGILPTPPFVANLSHEHKMTNLFTVGPRLGYAWDRWMWFVTGGGASATLKGQSCSNTGVIGLCGVTSANGQTDHQWGWYVGTGFDYMVHKGALVDVLLGVEYQHYDIGNHNAFCGGGLTCNVASGGPFDLSTTGDLVRARLTIKTQGYGWWGPSGGPAGY
jgi:outer membrane immunogenic protein